MRNIVCPKHDKKVGNKWNKREKYVLTQKESKWVKGAYTALMMMKYILLRWQDSKLTYAAIEKAKQQRKKHGQLKPPLGFMEVTAVWFHYMTREKKETRVWAQKTTPDCNNCGGDGGGVREVVYHKQKQSYKWKKAILFIQDGMIICMDVYTHLWHNIKNHVR